MAPLKLTQGSFSALPFTSGTVQNIDSRVPVEISDTQTAQSGLILAPGQKFSWNEKTLYARAYHDNTKNWAKVAVIAANTGGGGAGGGGGTTYKTMTVNIDLSNSNPATCCTYADDATTMTAGGAEWDSFFGIYPVMFSGGAEGKRLNVNNFAQHEDGTTADITTGAEGDVMIAFPRRGLKIETSGNILTVSMTDNPADSSFGYLAHQRGANSRDVFYLGAYKGFEQSGKLRSLSGKTITANKTIGAFRTLAHANGAGYEQSGFYQLTFRQAMYLLKYANLNSQAAVGMGYVASDNTAALPTGGTNTRGMDWGETTVKQHMKLFGLEDFWGNIWEWIDGCVTDANRNILTGTDNFNDSGNGYPSYTSGVTSNIGNFMNKPQGTTQTGFLAKEVNGSATTYFCDDTHLYASCVALFGSGWNNASTAGAFRLNVNNAASNAFAIIAARLMYL